MKITKSQLKRIIKEELENVLLETSELSSLISHNGTIFGKVQAYQENENPLAGRSPKNYFIVSLEVSARSLAGALGGDEGRWASEPEYMVKNHTVNATRVDVEGNYKITNLDPKQDYYVVFEDPLGEFADKKVDPNSPARPGRPPNNTKVLGQQNLDPESVRDPGDRRKPTITGLEDPRDPDTWIRRSKLRHTKFPSFFSDPYHTPGGEYNIDVISTKPALRARR